MTLTPKSLEVGKCYLTHTGRVWRIIRVRPDGRILYEQRSRRAPAKTWQPGMLVALAAEMLIEREVACDWTPEGNEHGQGMR